MASRDGLGVLPRRRNGKQQGQCRWKWRCFLKPSPYIKAPAYKGIACEPCRKAKVSCDHTLPNCARCRRRGITSKCVYLAAPMTRPVPDGRTRSEPVLTGMPPTPETGKSASPAASGGSFKDAWPKPTPESGPFIKSGGFFGKSLWFFLSLSVQVESYSVLCVSFVCLCMQVYGINSEPLSGTLWQYVTPK